MAASKPHDAEIDLYAACGVFVEERNIPGPYGWLRVYTFHYAGRPYDVALESTSAASEEQFVELIRERQGDASVQLQFLALLDLRRFNDIELRSETPE